jgi:uncharacterized NAD(P)/FAD-binding protein YdhS
MNNELKAPYDVVIVGSGYSGTMVAVHLARAQRGLRVALIDRSKTFGRGVAYGTTDPKHLLNVRADQMGAFPDDIGHFYRWLKVHPANLDAGGIHELGPDAFIPRLVFGDHEFAAQCTELALGDRVRNRHELDRRFARAGNNHCFPGRNDPFDQAREGRFGLVHVDHFHSLANLS